MEAFLIFTLENMLISRKDILRLTGVWAGEEEMAV